MFTAKTSFLRASSLQSYFLVKTHKNPFGCINIKYQSLLDKKIPVTDKKKYVYLENIDFRIKNLVSQLAKIEIAQQKREESEKVKV